MTDRRVLGIFAHPDDESLVAGGTLAACAAAGHDVRLLCMTRGGQGPDFSTALVGEIPLADRREAELRDASAILGVSATECLDYPDGGLKWLDAGTLEAEIATRIRRQRPDLVVTFGAEGLYWHSDHIAVYLATVDAIGALEQEGNRPALYLATWPRGLMGNLVAAMVERNLPADLWGLAPDAFGAEPSSITTVLDVGGFAATRLRALRAHRSQLSSEHLFTALPDDLAQTFLRYEYYVRRCSGSRGWAWPRGVHVA